MRTSKGVKVEVERGCVGCQTSAGINGHMYLARLTIERAIGRLRAKVNCCATDHLGWGNPCRSYPWRCWVSRIFLYLATRAWGCVRVPSSMQGKHVLWEQSAFFFFHTGKLHALLTLHYHKSALSEMISRFTGEMGFLILSNMVYATQLCSSPANL